jgi:DNA helicase IV
VPGEVIDLANRLLPHIAVGVPPGTAVRAGTDALSFAPGVDLVARVLAALDVEGSVGVIVPDARAASVLKILRSAEVAAVALDDEADERVTVVPASSAKGLEYDSVVLVEPAQIVAAEPSRPAGLRRLYVVLTRAVSRLAIVHDEPLPLELSP